MKKILISPGYGAGWSTWASGDVSKFMLTYKPIVEFIENGGKFTRDDCDIKWIGLTPDYSKVHPLLIQLIDECKKTN